MGFNEFKEKVMNDKEFAAKVKGFKSLEEAVEFGKKEGYTFTVEDIKNNSELTDAELEAVAGGASVMAKNWFVTK